MARKNRMRTASCKAKGRRLQQWFCSQLVEKLEIPQADCRSCSMGAGGEDVILSSAGRSLFPYSVECKNREAHNVWDSYKQCLANTPSKDLEPVVCIKRNGACPLVVVDASHFVSLVARANRALNDDTERLAISVAEAAVDEDIVVL